MEPSREAPRVFSLVAVTSFAQENGEQHRDGESREQPLLPGVAERGLTP